MGFFDADIMSNFSSLLSSCRQSPCTYRWSYLGYQGEADENLGYPSSASHAIFSNGDNTRVDVLARPTQQVFWALMTDRELWSSEWSQLKKHSFLVTKSCWITTFWLLGMNHGFTMWTANGSLFLLFQGHQVLFIFNTYIYRVIWTRS